MFWGSRISDVKRSNHAAFATNQYPPYMDGEEVGHVHVTIVGQSGAGFTKLSYEQKWREGPASYESISWKLRKMEQRKNISFS